MKDIGSNTGEYLAKYDTYIQYMNLPYTVNGSATKVRCEPVAVVNLDHPVSRRIRTCAHEIRHFRDGDLDRDADVDSLEK